jgi:hypothetical protein
MPILKRVLRIFGALTLGHFVAVNVLLAGKVLTDVSNLWIYFGWGDWSGLVGGYIGQTVLSTVVLLVMSFVPALIVLVFAEALSIRSKWFYMVVAGLGSALLDVACTSFDGLVSARSFCVAFSVSELMIVAVAGVAAGFTYWKVAGRDAGKWTRAATTLPSPA